MPKDDDPFETVNGGKQGVNFQSLLQIMVICLEERALKDHRDEPVFKRQSADIFILHDLAGDWNVHWSVRTWPLQRSRGIGTDSSLGVWR